MKNRIVEFYRSSFEDWLKHQVSLFDNLQCDKEVDGLLSDLHSIYLRESERENGFLARRQAEVLGDSSSPVAGRRMT